MAKSRRPPLTVVKPMSEINLTPLIDLTFLLLITFIITFPLMEQGIPVSLPKGRAADLKPDRARTVSVDKDSRIFLDNVPTTIDDLRRLLGEAVVSDPSVTVMVRADEAIAYGRLAAVLKALHEAKVTRLALVTQAE